MKSGLHHITAVASDPKMVVEFYCGVLGLRLVKKSVNQDDVSAYHLFFGDRTGEPGMDLTFFTFPGAGKGRQGLGQVTDISLAVPDESLEFWQKRFEEKRIEHDEVVERWGKKRLGFKDPDGMRLELVGGDDEEFEKAKGVLWETEQVSKEVAIGYFESSRLSVVDVRLIEPVLKVLGFEEMTRDGGLVLYGNESVKRAGFLEVEVDEALSEGIPGVGTVHHIAFAVEDEEEQLSLREEVSGLGLRPTGVIDRFYFKSVYFMTPAGILFELATMGPGFTADEEEDKLGEKLALPPFLEGRREEIEEELGGVR